MRSLLRQAVSPAEAALAAVLISGGVAWWEGCGPVDPPVRRLAPGAVVVRSDAEVVRTVVRRNEEVLRPSPRMVRLGRRLDGVIRAASRRHGVPEDLVRAVIHVESAFDPDAESPVGARGLMQLMPATAAEMGVGDPSDPAQNVDGGARYLRVLSERFGDDALVLAAYNAGPANVRRFGGVPPFRETRDYVRRVRALQRGYERLRTSR